MTVEDMVAVVLAVGLAACVVTAYVLARRERRALEDEEHACCPDCDEA